MDWGEYVEIDPRHFRPTEVDHLEGDFTRAREVLGWVPETSFDELVGMMIESDLELASREKVLVEAGHEVPQVRADM